MGILHKIASKHPSESEINFAHYQIPYKNFENLIQIKPETMRATPYCIFNSAQESDAASKLIKYFQETAAKDKPCIFDFDVGCKEKMPHHENSSYIFTGTNDPLSEAERTLMNELSSNAEVMGNIYRNNPGMTPENTALHVIEAMLFADTEGRYLSKSFCAMKKNAMIAHQFSKGHFVGDQRLMADRNNCKPTMHITKKIIGEKELMIVTAGALCQDISSLTEAQKSLFKSQSNSLIELHPNIDNPILKQILLSMGFEFRDYSFINSKYNMSKSTTVGETQFTARDQSDLLEAGSSYTSDSIDDSSYIPYKLLRYYTEHPDFLSEKDLQEVLYLALFANNHINNSLRDNAEFAPLLIKFITEHYETFEKQKNAQACVFLSFLKRRFEDHIQFIQSETPDHFTGVKTQFPDLHKRLNVLLSDSSVSDEDKSLIYREILLNYNHKKQITNPSAAIQYCTCILFLRDHPVPKKYANPQFDEILRKQKREVLESLQHLLPDDAILNALYEFKTGKISSHEWSTRECFPNYKDSTGNINLNVLEGILLEGGSTYSTLPSGLLKLKSFTAIFANANPIASISSDNTFFEFSFEGDEYCIFYTPAREGVAVIQRKHKGIWYLYVEASDLHVKGVSHISSMHIVDSCTHWASLQGQGPGHLMSIPKEGSKVHYRTDLQKLEELSFIGKAVKITRTSKQVDGTLQMHELGNPHDLTANAAPLSGFETIDYTDVWCNPRTHKVERIEFPRYKLKFNIVNHDGEKKALCTHPQGFYLAKKQFHPHFKHFSHYLLLENDSGEQRILIPNQTIEKCTDSSLVAKVTLNQNSVPSDDVKYFSYTVTPSGTLYSKQRCAQYHLAYIYLINRQYSRAHEILLRYGQASRAYTNIETEHLIKLCLSVNDTLDLSPEAVAIRTYAHFLKEKNSNEYHYTYQYQYENARYQYFQQYIHNSNAYLDKRKYCGHLALNSDEELFLSRLLYRQCKVTKYALRAAEISGDPLEETLRREVHTKQMETSPHAAKITPKTLISNTLIISTIKNNIHSQRKPLLLTRPGKNLYPYFLDYYAWALAPKDSAQHFQLLTRLTAMKGEQDPINAEIREILRVVMMNKDQFPSVDALRTGLEKNDIDFIISKFLRPCRSLYLGPPSSQVSKTPPSLTVLQSRPTKLLDPTSDLLELNESTDLLPCEMIPEEMKETFYENVALSAEEIADIESDNRAFIAALSKPEEEILPGVFDQVTDDIQAYQKLQEKHYSYRLFKRTQLAASTDTYVTLSESLKRDRAVCLLSILKLANKLPMDATEQSKRKLQLYAEETVELTLDDLLALYVKRDARAFQKMNPTLTRSDVQQLYQILTKFLLISGEIQRSEQVLDSLRELNSLEDLADNHSDVVNLEKKLVELMECQREYPIYGRKARAEYLVLEYYSHITLRESQVQKIELMLAKGTDSNVILQMIMGSGKSKVLLPILALMQANGKKLPVIVIPESLFESTNGDLSLMTNEAFRRHAHSIHIDRNSNMDMPHLEAILEKLKKTINDRDYLIMTSKSIQSLNLKYIEYLYNYSHGEMHPKLFKKIQCLEKILRLFKQRGHAIIDEADQILDCRFEVNFTLGTGVPIKSEHIALVSHLYQVMGTQEVHTEEQYHHTIKPTLIDKVIDKLIHLDEYHQLSSLKEYLTGLTTDEITLLKAYLSNSARGKSFPIDKAPCRDLLALLKHEFNDLLPITLVKNCDEHYGFSPDKHYALACPYKANNTPNPKSQFADHYELMNYTLQMYTKNKVPKHIVKCLIQKLRKEAKREVPSGDISQTQAARAFKSVCHDCTAYSLASITDQQIEVLTEHINADAETLYHFINNFILTEIKLYANKIRSTPQMLVNTFFSKQGFTGTTLNAETFPNSLRTIPEDGTNGKTLSILWKSCQDRLTQLDARSDPIDQIFDKFSNLKDFHAIIDAGALFKGVQNLEVAQLLMTKLPLTICGVIFYNDSNELMILDRENGEIAPLGETLLDPIQCFTYYDQRHITGSDIKQCAQAKALFTVGKDLRLRELFQGAWRLRGLDKEQSLHFVIDQEAQAKMGLEEDDELTLQDLFKFCIHNHSKKLAADHQVAARQKMQAVLQNTLMKTFLQSTVKVEETSNLFFEFEKSFVSTVEDSPYEQFGEVTEKTDKLTALKSMAEAAFPNRVYQRLSQHILFKRGIASKALRKVLAVEKISLPSHLDLKQVEGIEATTEVEAELEQENEAQVRTQVLSQTSQSDIKTHNPLKFWKWPVISVSTRAKLFVKSALLSKEIAETRTLPLVTGEEFPPLHSFRDVFHDTPDLKKYSSAFSNKLLFSNNVIPIITGSGSVSRPFASCNEAIQQVLIIKDRESATFRCLAISSAEAAYFLNLLIQDTRDPQSSYEQDICLYDLTLGPIQQSSHAIPLEELSSTPVRNLLIQMKFLNGTSTYSRMEQEDMKSFLSSYDSVKLAELFTNHIIKQSSIKQNAYRSGSLHRIFIELNHETDALIEVPDSYTMEDLQESLKLINSQMAKYPKVESDLRDIAHLKVDDIQVIYDMLTDIQHYRDHLTVEIRKIKIFAQRNNESESQQVIIKRKVSELRHIEKKLAYISTLQRESLQNARLLKEQQRLAAEAVRGSEATATARQGPLPAEILLRDTVTLYELLKADTEPDKIRTLLRRYHHQRNLSLLARKLTSLYLKDPGAGRTTLEAALDQYSTISQQFTIFNKLHSYASTLFPRQLNEDHPISHSKGEATRYRFDSMRHIHTLIEASPAAKPAEVAAAAELWTLLQAGNQSAINDCIIALHESNTLQYALLVLVKTKVSKTRVTATSASDWWVLIAQKNQETALFAIIQKTCNDLLPNHSTSLLATCMNSHVEITQSLLYGYFTRHLSNAYAPRDVGGGGDCLPRSAAQLLLGDAERHHTMRQTIFDEMSARSSHYQALYEQAPKVSSSGAVIPWDVYLATCNKKGVWMGRAEVAAISNSHRVPLMVVGNRGGQLRVLYTVGEEYLGSRPPIIVQNINEFHYVTMLPVAETA